MAKLLKVIGMSAILIAQSALLLAKPTKSRIQAAKHKKIVVDLSDKTLKFFVRGKLVKKYAVGIGKPATPSPIGTGYIRSKGDMIFRQTKGPNKGKIIIWTQIKIGRWVKIPYEEIRGFGMAIPGYNPFQYYIHSVTNPENIGKASSKGCIRMAIPDMLELYPLVDLRTKVIIKL